MSQKTITFTEACELIHQSELTLIEKYTLIEQIKFTDPEEINFIPKFIELGRAFWDIHFLIHDKAAKYELQEHKNLFLNIVNQQLEKNLKKYQFDNTPKGLLN